MQARKLIDAAHQICPYSNLGISAYPLWDEMFDEHLNFHIVYNSDGENTMYRINRKPRATESSIYIADSKQGFATLH